MELDDEQLIDEIRKHKSIYMRGKFSPKVRSSDWKEVAKNLNYDEAECLRRWKHLRDKFVRLSKKSLVTGQELSNDYWPLYKRMSFLEEYVEHRNMPKQQAEKFEKEVKLLEVVRKNDIIWNTSNSHFYNIRDRNLSWLKVAYILQEPESQCRERWNKLRSKLSTKLKGGSFNKWILAEHIKFLVPHNKQYSRNDPFNENFDDSIDNDENGDNDNDGYDDTTFGGDDSLTNDNTEDGTLSDTEQNPLTDPLVVNETGEDELQEIEEMDIIRLENFNVEEDIKEMEYLIDVDDNEVENKPFMEDSIEEDPSYIHQDSPATLKKTSPKKIKIKEHVELKKEPQSSSTATTTPSTKKATTSTDPFYAALGVFFEKINASKATQYKMDVLNYAHKRFNELQEDD